MSLCHFQSINLAINIDVSITSQHPFPKFFFFLNKISDNNQRLDEKNENVRLLSTNWNWVLLIILIQSNNVNHKVSSPLTHTNKQKSPKNKTKIGTHKKQNFKTKIPIL